MPQIKDKLREEFEAWNTNAYGTPQRAYHMIHGAYADMLMEKRFAAYQAASASRMELERDAMRYRWLRDQRNLLLESDGGKWQRPDGSWFINSHRLCVGDTQFAASESLDEAIDAARAALSREK